MHGGFEKVPSLYKLLEQSGEEVNHTIYWYHHTRKLDGVGDQEALTIDTASVLESYVTPCMHLC